MSEKRHQKFLMSKKQHQKFLDEEVDYLKNYLLLEQNRLGAKLQFNIDIKDLKFRSIG